MSEEITKKSLVGLNLDELKEIVAQEGGSNYRATQIYNAIYLKSLKSINLITELPLSFREALSEKYVFSDVVIKDKQVSRDGTVKFLFELSDGNLTEAVLIKKKSNFVLKNLIFVMKMVGFQEKNSDL